MADNSISIVIVTWNHLTLLKDCLESIFAQTYQSFNITIIDNASSDGTTNWIKEKFPEINIIANAQNLGFCTAFNKGIHTTKSPYILSVNPDVVMHPECLEFMTRALDEDAKVGIVAAKLLRSENKQLIDSTGLFINRFRRPYDRGQGELDHGQYDQSKLIFGACGALALYRREMLNDLRYQNEYLDEDFFAYYEDADLAWRAQLCSWQVIFEPRAIGSHVRGWGDSLRKQRKKDPTGPRLALRNRYLMILKNDRWSSFLIDLPLIISVEIPKLIYTFFYMPHVLLGILDLFKLIKPIQHKRMWLWKKPGVSEKNLRTWFISSSGAS